MSRNSITRLRAATAAALLSLTLAAPAFAHDGDRGYPVYRHDERCDHDHGDWRGDRWRDRDYDRDGWGRDSWSRDGWGRSGWNRDGDRRYDRRGEYGCRPCNRRFTDRTQLYRHLAREHGVPFGTFRGWSTFGR
jgi:hypothetical protein